MGGPLAQVSLTLDAPAVLTMVKNMSVDCEKCQRRGRMDLVSFWLGLSRFDVDVCMSRPICLLSDSKRN